MLQQTRVATVIPYYERFLAEFPTVASLATASEDRVLARWSGLGYYSRARNLRRAARETVERHGGHLPDEPQALAALPGVGRYTLGAILSIAFDRPWPVVDGNVARVLSRVFALTGDRRRPANAERLWKLAGSLVPRRSPGDFNQALMELGATVCLPRAPRCPECPVRRKCLAYSEDRPEAYPESRPRKPAEVVRAAALILESRRGIWLERRTSGANRGLFDVPSAEGFSGSTPPKGFGPPNRRLVGRFRHGILSRIYAVALYHAWAEGKELVPGAEGKWVPRSRLLDVPLTARARKSVAMLDSNSRGLGSRR
jgi:A/G-specific adenine glycosylase